MAQPQIPTDPVHGLDLVSCKPVLTLTLFLSLKTLTLSIPVSVTPTLILTYIIPNPWNTVNSSHGQLVTGKFWKMFCTRIH